MRGSTVAVPYGWRDILMEKAGFSRQEYRILTDSTLTLKQIYGFDAARPDAVARRHAAGGRTARENIEDLVDEGSGRA